MAKKLLCCICRKGWTKELDTPVTAIEDESTHLGDAFRAAERGKKAHYHAVCRLHAIAQAVRLGILPFQPSL